MALVHIAARAKCILGLILVATLASGSAFATNWLTFAGSNNRLGVNPQETVLTPQTVSGLTVLWTTKFPTLSKTQPLYMEQVTTTTGTHNEVFTTLINGTVAAMNAANGKIDWQVQLPVSNPPPGGCGFVGFGIAGTPTIDPVAGILYVVDGAGALHALSIGTGAENLGYPVQVIDPVNLALGAYNHSSPTLVGSQIFVTTSVGGNCEPAAPTHGAIYAFSTITQTVTASFFPLSATNIGGGGIWGPGGAMVDPATGALWVATGNAYAKPQYQPLALSIISLDTSLGVLQSASPGAAYFPATGDADFGSTPTPIDVPNCPALLAVLSKTGNLFIYQRANLSAGPVQVIDMSLKSANSPFIGMAAYDPATQLLVINNPISSPNGAFTNGAIALQAPSSPACQTSSALTTAWQTAYGSDKQSPITRATDPVIAGGLVWVATGANDTVLALNETTGAPVWSSGSTLRSPIQYPVTVADGIMFVQTYYYLWAFGLPAQPGAHQQTPDTHRH
jgi:outer membrane protein assembly factor BamB